MIKKIVLFLVAGSIFLQANNFSDGIRAYRSGDFEKAKSYFKEALTKDKVHNAAYMLGKMYLSGDGVTKNIDKAIEYLELSHKFGNIMAGCYASSAYLEKGILDAKIIERGLSKGVKKGNKFCLEVQNKWINEK